MGKEMTIGVNIRNLRLKRGLTQKQLASKVGVSPGMITQIERGTRNPSIPKAEKIAKILKTTLSKLFCE